VLFYVPLRFSLLLALPWLLSVACTDDATHELIVELRTDYLPGVHFSTVQTEYALGPFDRAGEPVRDRQIVGVRLDQRYTGGERVAEFSGVPEGRVYLRLFVADATGAALAARRVVVNVRETTAVVVQIASGCSDLDCPDGAEIDCPGGRCVTTHCVAAVEGECGRPPCASDSDCTVTAACAIAACVDAECLAVADDVACDAGFFCDTQTGCRPRSEIPDAGPLDAGPPRDGGPPAADAGTDACPAIETTCTDGLDDDCDGNIDCTDPDCDAETCSDGVFCNGPDTCSGGVCVPGSTDPCAGEMCFESRRACGNCSTRADCPADGSTSSCRWTSSCAEVTYRRTWDTTWSCVDNACVSNEVITDEPGACTRDTDGNRCGSLTYGMWTCTYAGECDETGDASRTVDGRMCMDGSCSAGSRIETRPDDASLCSRSTTGNLCRCNAGCTSCVCGADVCQTSPPGC
jgi:uncharacterized cupin superfamily protein